MDVITIDAKPRKPGKSGARAARQAGEVPCVLYGHNVEPVTFQVPDLSLRPLVYTSETHRVAIRLEGRTFDCITKDIDFDKVTDRPMHVDFQVLKSDEKITLNVPVHYVGTPVGKVQQGGEVTVLIHAIGVSCLPGDIPAAIEVDVTGLEVGQSLHVSDLDVAGVTFLDPPETALITVSGPRPEQPEEAEGPELVDTEAADTAEADSEELL